MITCLYYLSGWEISDGWEFREIQDAICKYTGTTKVEILGEQEPEIDHQSKSYDEDVIINFVFNKYVSLKTDCD